jgi:hypothetical protein
MSLAVAACAPQHQRIAAHPAVPSEANSGGGATVPDTLRVELAVSIDDSAASAAAISALLGASAELRIVNTGAAPETDVRDLVDAGVDWIVSRDPAVLRYAAADSTYAMIPLGWDVTYVLTLDTLGTALDTFPRQAASSEALAFREAMAREAVRGEARAARPPWPWEDGTCTADTLAGSAMSALRSSAIRGRVVYPSNDVVARGIAERLVALADRQTAGSSTPFVVAVPLSLDAMETASRRGDESALVVRIRRPPYAACAEIRRLTVHGRIVIPLIDVRPWLLARRDALGRVADSTRLRRAVSADTAAAERLP